MTLAYYNEIEPYCVQWIGNLGAAGHVAKGWVDDRSIADVRPDDLRRFGQCHFFAGIAVWSYALRCAGWPDDRKVWTGSCPCQPFSCAGKRKGTADARHLWPEWFRLIRECRPVTVFGEQVGNKDGIAWFDAVQSDLESCGYTVGAVVAPAAGFGAPHQRHRLYFVAHTGGVGRQAGGASEPGYQIGPAFANNRSVQGFVGDSASQRRGEAGPSSAGPSQRISAPRESGVMAEPKDTDGRGEQQMERAGRGRCGPSGSGELGDANGLRQPGKCGTREKRTPESSAVNFSPVGQSESEQMGVPGQPRRPRGPVNGFWHDAEWIACTDGKARAAKPGTFPLASKSSARVGRLRAYGNAIVAEQATEFIKAFMESPIGQAINLIETTKDK